MQMGEWVRFPNGDIANYIDAQRPTAPSRIGLRFVRSQDGGHNFGPVERVGKIDGVEYGYAFESITRDQSTWMLVMTFANLDGGGEPVFGAGSQPGTVDVIRSDDNGTNWRFVANITRELGGAPINESSFVPYGDGFLVAARGYDRQQWLLRTDSDFKLLHRVDLASTHPFIRSSLGRPRVFTHDGGWYLLARNTLEPGATVAEGVKGNPMRLSLFEFDPLSLMITRHFVLDNAEGENVADGYYAVPYWHERDGKEYLSVITYKRLNASGPDLIRLEFDWSEFQ
jgi:hypothetical protein